MSDQGNREWYLHDNGQQIGPYTPEEVASMVASGRVSGSAQAWREGMSTWIPIVSVPPPQPASPQNAYQSSPGPSPADRCWMVNDRGSQHGPHSQSELASFVAAGTISPMAMAWRQGLPQWIPLSSIVQMPGYAPTGPAPHLGYQPFPAAASSNRVTAGIFGILLGGLGIHKFILGYPGAGIAMLLVTVLTCGWGGSGWGGIVMGVIGLVEGIIYLTKSDAQFYQEYVVNRKQWF
jgi:TM2 domain-containing membrane protein YozV